MSISHSLNYYSIIIHLDMGQCKSFNFVILYDCLGSFWLLHFHDKNCLSNFHKRVIIFSLYCYFIEGKDSILASQGPGICLTCKKYSINILWMNKWNIILFNGEIIATTIFSFEYGKITYRIWLAKVHLETNPIHYQHRQEFIGPQFLAC